MAFVPPPASVTVDLVALTVHQGGLAALLVRRGEAPYRGRHALPGGFVRQREDLDQAAGRELAEETGLAVDGVYVEQLASYGHPRRDPRGRVVTVAYLALVPGAPAVRGGGDAARADWVDLDTDAAIPSGLAFDHARILSDGVGRARAKLEYTPLATVLCLPEFTVAELRLVYESMWGVALDPRNFHRKVTRAEGFLEATGRTTGRNGGRPAQLYRRGTARLLMPPMLRPDPS
ncbi:MAG TPA: NUDIX domain-containing protein [Egibacteraceae bacterium]|nr:NUDIX domain-containing protein [Egibacteraceae bacterium]